MKPLLDQYTDLVLAIPLFEHIVREDVEFFRAQTLLADGSNLHISEVWIDGELRKYAYFWLDESNDLIRGWDNAPHHPEVSTHPHHQHVGEAVQPSDLRTLQEVLEFLSSQILP